MHLMERITQREPNAYLAALYWDSEMFGRRTRTRRELESDTDTRDFKALLAKMFSDRDRCFTTPRKRLVARRYRNLFIRMTPFATARDYREMYDAIMRGDPKLRAYRALFQNVYSRYAETALSEREAVTRNA